MDIDRKSASAGTEPEASIAFGDFDPEAVLSALAVSSLGMELQMTPRTSRSARHADMCLDEKAMQDVGNVCRRQVRDLDADRQQTANPAFSLGANPYRRRNGAGTVRGYVTLGRHLASTRFISVFMS